MGGEHHHAIQRSMTVEWRQVRLLTHGGAGWGARRFLSVASGRQEPLLLCSFPVARNGLSVTDDYILPLIDSFSL